MRSRALATRLLALHAAPGAIQPTSSRGSQSENAGT